MGVTAVLVVIVLVSAWVSLSPEARKMRVIQNEDVVADCMYLREVTGKSGWAGASEDNAYESGARQ